jgi:hypothetical protein
MEILRKITIKTCGDFSVKKIKELLDTRGPVGADGKPGPVAEGETVPLLKITGESNGAKTGQTDKGTFTKLMGTFVGVDLTTGSLYQSQQCILPEFVGGALGAALLGGQPVTFAFEIGAKRKDSAVTGYEFVVQPLINAKPTDKMLALMQAAGIEVPALALEAGADPAPAPTPAPAPAPTPAPAAKSAKK